MICENDSSEGDSHEDDDDDMIIVTIMMINDLINDKKLYLQNRYTETTSISPHFTPSKEKIYIHI